jgi:hypothetical protein
LHPRSTHKLQPLDKTFKATLKQRGGENIHVDSWKTCNIETQTWENAVNGFRGASILPINRDTFSGMDFVAAKERCRQEVTNSSNVADCNQQASVSTSTSCNSLDLQ